MLVLTRKRGETLFIGDDIRVTVLEVRGNQVRLGVSAPKDVHVRRNELKELTDARGGDGSVAGHAGQRTSPQSAGQD